MRFYLNDGTPVNGYATPDTLFYDTGPFDVQTPYSALGIDYAVLGFTNADLYTDALLNLTPGYQMPDNFTISITFSNLSGSDQVGLPSFEPPTVGTNYGDYWVNFGGVSWIPLTNSVAGAFQPVAFGMQIFWRAGASHCVPGRLGSRLGWRLRRPPPAINSFSNFVLTAPARRKCFYCPIQVWNSGKPGLLFQTSS